jgi:hypothetical protein
MGLSFFSETLPLKQERLPLNMLAGKRKGKSQDV